ncbi:MAG TPA: hypothetical protein VF108_12550 [Actinomycetota bacterium]
MARIPTQLSTLDRFVRGLVRGIRRLAVAGALGVVPIALLFRREDGFDALDAVVTVLLLAPAAIVLLFAQGVLELVKLPERFRRMPGEGQERLSELTRIAGEARSARVRSAPFLLWRLRGTIGSVRDVAGIAMPLRVLTPGFLGLAALATLACAVLAGAGLVALLVLVAG